jgi:hypothetical protein
MAGSKRRSSSLKLPRINSEPPDLEADDEGTRGRIPDAQLLAETLEGEEPTRAQAPDARLLAEARGDYIRALKAARAVAPPIPREEPTDEPPSGSAIARVALKRKKS